jgi:DNA-binding GntR family transcriptional regulator
MPRSPRDGAAARGRALVRRAPPALRPDAGVIHDRILQAVLEHRLPPGTQLVEEKLAAVFGVSRTQVRHALARLAQSGIVVLHRHRGAFVASPTREEAHEMFAACRLIEPALARHVAGHATPEHIRTLRAHLRREQAARRSGDRHALVRLTASFHLLLAEMAGNRVLARAMREIEALSSLVVILYDTGAGQRMCREDEHALLVDAIAAGKGERAARLMLQHIDHIEAELDLSAPVARAVDLAEVFG